MVERKKKIKLAFTGTCCSGKTTLLNEVANRHRSDTYFIPEAARYYFHLNPDVNRRSLEVQGNIQIIQQRFEEEAIASGEKILIGDRSVLDAPVYMYHYNDKKGAEGLLNRVRLWLPTYTEIFLLDPEGIPYQQDEIRTESEQERLQIHQAYLEFFNLFNIKYKLLNGSVDQRLAGVEETMSMIS